MRALAADGSQRDHEPPRLKRRIEAVADHKREETMEPLRIGNSILRLAVVFILSAATG
jgi:hypothetical protein